MKAANLEQIVNKYLIEGVPQPDILRDPIIRKYIYLQVIVKLKIGIREIKNNKFLKYSRGICEILYNILEINYKVLEIKGFICKDNYRDDSMYDPYYFDDEESVWVELYKLTKKSGWYDDLYLFKPLFHSNKNDYSPHTLRINFLKDAIKLIDSNK